MAEESGGRKSRALPAPAGELARFAELEYGEPAAKPAAKPAKPAKKPAKKPAAKPAAGKRKQPEQPSAAAAAAAASDDEVPEAVGAAGDAAADAAPGKRPKLSTAVNLLDARTAKTEGPRPALPSEGISQELRGFPEVTQRFMAGQGFSEAMPIQSRWAGEGVIGGWMCRAARVPLDRGAALVACAPHDAVRPGPALAAAYVCASLFLPRPPAGAGRCCWRGGTWKPWRSLAQARPWPTCSPLPR